MAVYLAEDSFTQRNIYEGLVLWYPEDYQKGQPSPGLATSWEISPDGLVYTFHLRQGVKFYPSGEPFDANSVKLNWDRIISLAGPAAYRLTDFVDKYEVVDNYTFKVTLKRPFAPFLRMMADQQPFGIINPKVWQQYPDSSGTSNPYLFDHTDGTGPYSLKEWTKGQRIVLEANPTYWGGWNEQHVKTITERIFPSANTITMLLSRGDIDIGGLDLGSLPQMKESIQSVPLPHLKILGLGEPMFNWKHFHMDNMHLPFSDKNVRMAFQYAFNYQGFVHDVMADLGIVAEGCGVPGLLGHPTDPDERARLRSVFDLSKAKDHLDMASSDAKKALDNLTIYNWASWDEARNATSVLTSGLAQIGVKPKLEEYDIPTLYAKCGENVKVPPGRVSLVPMIYDQWRSGLGDPDDYFWGMFHTSQFAPIGWNLNLYGNAETDAMLLAGRVETDVEKRRKIYHDFIWRIHDDAVRIEVWIPAVMQSVYWDWVQGLRHDPAYSDSWPDHWKTWKELPTWTTKP